MNLKEVLSRLGSEKTHQFAIPSKRINDGDDVSFFLTSKAYTDLMTFLLQLNTSSFPWKPSSEGAPAGGWSLTANSEPFSPAVSNLRSLIKKLDNIIDEAPPDTGPRRFGNVSFRRWYEIVIERAPTLLQECFEGISSQVPFAATGETTAQEELQAYFLGSFGSAQRLDYGSGHELSFLAFLGCMWKLGMFKQTEPGVEERDIVIGVFQPYLDLIRKLILTYTLEPAGSHGVWGLDDHSFIPYIWGSAQFSPAINGPEDIPSEGSAPNAPNPGDVAKADAVDRLRATSMYFSAIGFIYDVKKGPFWEHSPILFDISGVPAGWAKINKGMMKMYNAEVLSKLPVVQHFPFGSLFRWEKDPNAVQVAASIHTSNQPSKHASTAASQRARQDGMKMPPARDRSQMPPTSGTAAPWAATSRTQMPPSTGTAAPWATSSRAAVPPAAAGTTTAAPWARPPSPGLPPQDNSGATRAPWANSALPKR
ncbi:phosphotyrosyl phosphatase activator [Aulographum hederae CBS 113979]|uniref:Serine/threonine-protein phosphatase 2A activator n=1 Tax=Aulographum hederae CBS 113979 TaxID=1176131 RepID=A0A6G1GVF5_9PEZI|nr:phosphotyrosyl phosphatase activator [Aulographum hederae CBS 113979]